MKAPHWPRAVAGPHALTMSGWLLLGALLVPGALTMLVGGLGEPLVSAMTWALASWVAVGAVWLLARVTWMRWGDARHRQWLILPTFLLAGIARAVVLAANAPSTTLRTTILVSALNTTFLSIIAAVVVDRLRTLNVVAGQLEATRAGLLDAQSRAVTESAQLRAASREAIVAAVREAVGDGHDAPQVAEGLREVSYRVVRPLSHDLASSPDDALELSPAPPRRDLRSVARATLDAGPIRPAFTTALYCALTVPLAVFVHGWAALLIVLALTAISILALLGLASLVPWARLRTWSGVLLLCVVLALVGFASVLILRVRFPSQMLMPGVAISAALFLLLVGGSVAVLQGVARRQEQIAEWLMAATSRLSEVVRVEQASLRREKRHLARVLHGVVQPRLVARALQLQRSDGGIDLSAIEAEIITLLSKEAEALNTVDVVRAVQDMAEVWADTVLVTVEADPSTSQVLRPYPACAFAMVEVAREAINNAVLRGGARWVQVLLTIDAEGMWLVVSNDIGAPHRPSDVPGMGSATFNELCDAWQLTTDESSAQFSAQFRLNEASKTVAGEGRTEENDVITDEITGRNPDMV